MSLVGCVIGHVLSVGEEYDSRIGIVVLEHTTQIAEGLCEIGAAASLELRDQLGQFLIAEILHGNTKTLLVRLIR